VEFLPLLVGFETSYQEEDSRQVQRSGFRTKRQFGLSIQRIPISPMYFGLINGRQTLIMSAMHLLNDQHICRPKIRLCVQIYQQKLDDRKEQLATDSSLQACLVPRCHLTLFFLKKNLSRFN
jgi:hypothetical protein